MLATTAILLGARRARSVLIEAVDAPVAAVVVATAATLLAIGSRVAVLTHRGETQLTLPHARGAADGLGFGVVRGGVGELSEQRDRIIQHVEFKQIFDDTVDDEG